MTRTPQRLKIVTTFILVLCICALTACGTSTKPGKPGKTGIAGNVSILPSCATAQKTIPKLTCASLLQRSVTLQILQYNTSNYHCCTANPPSFTETIHSNNNGSFQVTLPPGEYTIQAMERVNQVNVLPIQPPFDKDEIPVKPGHITTVTVPYTLSALVPECSAITGACPPDRLDQPDISITGYNGK